MALSIATFLDRFNYYILNPVIELLFGIAFIYFFYGIIKFIQSDAGDKGSARAEARSAILWGMVGMLIMFSVYGIISKFLLPSFGINPSDPTLHLQNAKPYLKL